MAETFTPKERIMSDKDNFDTGYNPDRSQGGIPKDDTDISGMEYQDAADYVLSFVTTLKQTEKLVKEIEKESDLWKQRVTLAESQGKIDLAEGARKKLDEIETKRAKLNAEVIDLAGKCTELVQNLKKIKATGVKREIDTDMLLAQFEVILGDKAKADYSLNKSVKDEEANAELQKLKERMQGEKKE
jgi:hypothetical protein